MKKKSKNRLIFVSGGSRSGKSHYAECRADEISGRRTYVATCSFIDEEMEHRIARHQQQRSGKNWDTIEAPLDLAQALNDCHDSSVVLVDCLTLWVNNLLYEAQTQHKTICEDDVAALCQQVADAGRQGERTIIFVTNELGMGLVPADSTSRLYRDLAGRCNQTLAALSDEVVFLVSGCPLSLKGEQTK